MVHQPALYHIDKLVVAARVGRQHEESRINQIANGVIDDAFHDLTVEELEPHPNAVDDRCAGMKVEMIANRVSVEAVYVKDGFNVLDRDFFNDTRIEMANPKGFGRAVGRIAQQLFDRVPTGGFEIALDRPGPELDHDLFRICGIFLDHEWRAFSLQPGELPDRTAAIYILMILNKL